MWSEAVDRSHSGANCVLDRLAKVYDEVGEMDCLASVNSHRNSNPILNTVAHQLIEVQDCSDDSPESQIEPASREFLILNFEASYDPVSVLRSHLIQEWAEDGFDASAE